jgi:hypothetical protein
MHAVIRSYSGPGAKELVDLIVQRKEEVEVILRGVAGFRSWMILRTEDGGATVTVCEDKAGTDESMQAARNWITANASDLGIAPPEIIEGNVPAHFGE